jgi:hypothetical protein
MSTAAKPSAADRLRRGGPTVQETRSVSGGVRVKPVRVTVDLDPKDYDDLREFAHRERMTHTDVLRTLVQLLAMDDVAHQVRKSVVK